jgi:hypothetical protein
MQHFLIIRQSPKPGRRGISGKIFIEQFPGSGRPPQRNHATPLRTRVNGASKADFGNNRGKTP